MLIGHTTSTEGRLSPALLWWCWGLGHLAMAAAHVAYGGMNPDEGFYAAAARSVMSGEMPYRDFGYTQTPLLPYFNGPWLAILGYGLFAQRAVNGLWIALTLVLMGGYLARRHGPLLACVVLLFFSFNAPWMYFTHLGKTYAFCGLLCTLASIFFLSFSPGWRKAALLGFIGVLGVGCRLPSIPFFAALWAASVVEIWREGPRPLFFAVGAPMMLAVVLLGPFWWAAPESATFWTLEFHLVSVPNKDWRLAPSEVFLLAPAICMGTALAWGGWLMQRQWSRPMTLMLGGCLALACNLYPAGVYEEYAVPFLPALAIGIVSALDSHVGLPRHTVKWFVPVMLLAQLAAAPVYNWRNLPERRFTASAWLTPKAPDYNPDLPAQIARVKMVSEKILEPGGHIAGPNIILALTMDRPIDPACRMGPFSATAEIDQTHADKLCLTTPAKLGQMFADPRTQLLAFFNRSLLNYAWSMPSFRNIPMEDRRQWIELFRRDYRVVFQEGDFLLLARAPPDSTARP